MPDTKIADLTTIPSVVDADVLHIVDVSAGTSYKITRGALLASIGGGQKILIETITNPGSGEFDFGPALAGGIIPAGYKRLKIEGHIRSTQSAADIIQGFFNADLTKTNYHQNRQAVNEGAHQVGEANHSEISVCPGSPAVAGSYAGIDITIENYDSDKLKNAKGTYWALDLTSEIWAGSSFMSHKTMTAVVTRFRVRTDAHPTDTLLGELRLYGEY